METKKCTNCEEVFEASTEYFYRQKNGKFGLSSKCKTCSNKKVSAYREANREKDREYALKYYYKNKEKILKKQKKYLDENPEKRREKKEKQLIYQKTKGREKYLEYHKQYYQKNRDDYLEKVRIYRAENKEAIKERAKVYYEKNKDKINESARKYRLKNKEKLSKYYKKYCQENPDYSNEKWHKRRALIRNSKVGRMPKGYRKIIFNNTNGKCWWCGKQLDESDWHLDHLIPLKKGGSHTMDNLVPSCPACNLSKNDKLPHEFMEGRLL